MIVTVGIVVALVFAVVDLIRSRGQALTSWGLAILAAALLIGRL